MALLISILLGADSCPRDNVWQSYFDVFLAGLGYLSLYCPMALFVGGVSR